VDDIINDLETRSAASGGEQDSIFQIDDLSVFSTFSNVLCNGNEVATKQECNFLLRKENKNTSYQSESFDYSKKKKGKKSVQVNQKNLILGDTWKENKAVTPIAKGVGRKISRVATKKKTQK